MIRLAIVSLSLVVLAGCSAGVHVGGGLAKKTDDGYKTHVNIGANTTAHINKKDM